MNARVLLVVGAGLMLAGVGALLGPVATPAPEVWLAKSRPSGVAVAELTATEPGLPQGREAVRRDCEAVIFELRSRQTLRVLPGARVSFAPGTQRRTDSDEHGRIVVDFAEPSPSVTVRTAAEEFLVPLRSDSTAGTVVPVHIHEPNRVRIRVLDTAGRWVAGAKVFECRRTGVDPAMACSELGTTSGAGELDANLVPASFVKAHCRGFAPSLEVRVGPAPEVEVRLRPACALEVLVLDSQGSPCPQVRVALRRPSRLIGAKAFDAEGVELDAVTDAHGRVGWFDLPPGSLEVTAYGMAGVDLAQVELESLGAAHRCLRLRPPVELRGTVVNASGERLPGLDVWIETNAREHRVVTDVQGHLALALPPELVGATVTIGARSPTHGVGTCTVDRAELGAPIALTLSSAGSLRGRVVGGGGPYALQVIERFDGQSWSRWLAVDHECCFTTASATGAGLVRVFAGGIEVARASAVHAEECVIPVPDRLASLHGRIALDDGVASTGTVVLYDPATEVSVGAAVGADGTFALCGLPAARYAIGYQHRSFGRQQWVGEVLLEDALQLNAVFPVRVAGGAWHGVVAAANPGGLCEVSLESVAGFEIGRFLVVAGGKFACPQEAGHYVARCRQHREDATGSPWSRAVPFDVNPAAVTEVGLEMPQ